MTRIQNYSVSIASERRTIVQVDDFQVAENGVTFLFGESGIGKSIVCKAIYGLLDPSQLDITINGQPYERYLAGPHTRRISDSSFFVFQEPSTHLNPLMRISEQLREGDLGAARNEDEVLRRLWKTGDDTVRQILEVFPKPHRPSGGEKQRLLLAMAFKKIALTQARTDDCPTFFVFDEPTGSLDNQYRDLFLDSLLECYARKPFTAVFITHDYSIISALYARHQRLLPNIHFKELNRLGESRVSVRDFSAEEYLGWLRNATPAAPAGSGAETVLTVEPSLRIFGRTLTIFADKQRSRALPLTIRRGEMVYVKAPSGVGKTTLAKVIMGLYAPREFAMTLGGHAVTHQTPARFWQRRVWGKLASMVFQHADEALNLQAVVREVFDGLPLGRRMRAEQLRQRLGELFEGGINDAFLRKRVALLSGGQKQRLNLLRSLVLGTDLLILDEPLNALDFDSVRKVLEILDRKRAEGAALLMISHNEEIFDSIVDEERVYYLAQTA